MNPHMHDPLIRANGQDVPPLSYIGGKNILNVIKRTIQSSLYSKLADKTYVLLRDYLRSNCVVLCVVVLSLYSCNQGTDSLVFSAVPLLIAKY